MCFFFLISKEEYILEKDAKRVTQGIQECYTCPQIAQTKKKLQKRRYHHNPTLKGGPTN